MRDIDINQRIKPRSSSMRRAVTSDCMTWWPDKVCGSKARLPGPSIWDLRMIWRELNEAKKLKWRVSPRPGGNKHAPFKEVIRGRWGSLGRRRRALRDEVGKNHTGKGLGIYALILDISHGKVLEAFGQKSHNLICVKKLSWVGCLGDSAG